jgi:signal transduction histidine kinase
VSTSIDPTVPAPAPHPLTSAFHASAYACMIFAFLLVESVQVAYRDALLWLPLVLLIPFALLLRHLRRELSAENALAYLLGGGLIVGLFSAMVMSEVDVAASTDAAPYMLLKLALLLGGGPVLGWLGTICWPLAGFVVGESAVRAAALYSGGTVEADLTTLAALIAVLVTRVMTAVVGRPNAKVRATLRRAARQEELAMARARAELNASALLHDTVLRDLSHLRSAGTGPLDEQLRERLRFDLELLANGTWATLRPARADSDGAAVSPDFNSVVTVVREQGLKVDVTGDHTAVDALNDDRRLALALAMHQCLVNVSEHAGVDRAEVTLARTDVMVSVMVVDSGRGFRIEDTAPDRLGLRQSVLRRMTEVGGNARVWSVPGEGTTVQLLLPVGRSS